MSCLVEVVNCNDGIASYCETLATGLHARGVQIQLVSGIVRSDEKSEYKRQKLAAAVKQWHVVPGLRKLPSLSIFMQLWKLHGTQPRNIRLPEDFDTMAENGGAIAGSPGTIRDKIARLTEDGGTNYFISQFSFGDLREDEVQNSALIFAKEMGIAHPPLSSPAKCLARTDH